MIVFIDGDSMIFMLGYVHREHQDKDEMYKSVDDFLDNIFTQTGADMYYGAIAGTVKCFRYDKYKVKPYKGNRPEMSDYMKFWRPVVTDYLVEKWKFDRPGTETYEDSYGMEADDLIFTAAAAFKLAGQDHIICSPDKDLRIMSGLHFDYRTNEFKTVDEHQAIYNFFTLMLEGDDTDNIAGIPGYGEKKRKEKLNPLLDAKAGWTSYEELVKSLYHKHFGPYYGNIIYAETHDTIALVWDQEKEVQVHSVPEKIHPFNELSGTH